MPRNPFLNVLLRLLALCAGVAALSGVVYAAGRWLVPLTGRADKAILAWLNPDSYVPGVDQFMRAATDYSNFIIAAPLISWMVAYGLYRLLPRFKPVFTGVLVVEAVVVAVLAALGKVWPNETYVGANVLLVVFCLLAFGGAALAFHRMEHDGMRRFALVFWLVLASALVTHFAATERIKSGIARPRPLNDAHKPWNEQVRIIPDETLRGASSYPSGHTSGTFALLAPLFWYVRRRGARAGLLGWSALQGVTRVYTAAHFPFDVFMGGVLGFGVGTLVFFTLGGPRLRAPAETGAETA